MYFTKGVDKVQGCRGGRNAQFGSRESWEESGKVLQRRKHLGRVFKTGIAGREREHVQRQGEAQKNGGYTEL